MEIQHYEMDVIYPCADYEGVTIEGRFKNIDIISIYNSLKLIADKISLLKSANIIICSIGSSDMYIYEDRKFIISKIQSKLIAETILNKIINKVANKEN